MDDRTKKLLQAMLDRVKRHRMKPKSGDEEIQTAYPFLEPVVGTTALMVCTTVTLHQIQDTVQFPDYLSIVHRPVDLGSIEDKLKNDE